VRLLLVGPVPDREALSALLSRVGPRRSAIVTGRVPFAELPVHIEAADVVAHLRYPTARETSAALLRVLAQGRPTVISDLEHLADIPHDAALRADLSDEEGDLTRAILRLAADRTARDRLARAAAAFVATEHSPARCREAYERAIALALSRPAPAPRSTWPEHWRRLENAS
jgi:glycosyltransferase involved in cell wall biosynthesis